VARQEEHCTRSRGGASGPAASGPTAKRRRCPHPGQVTLKDEASAAADCWFIRDLVVTEFA
jgi:hypothetical protein